MYVCVRACVRACVHVCVYVCAGRDIISDKTMSANDPRGMTSLDPKGLNCRIYVVDHYTLLHNKYISCGPDGFREEDLLSFSHYMSRPSGHGKFRPLGLH